VSFIFDSGTESHPELKEYTFTPKNAEDMN
jgi:hypothetical protein